MRADSARLDYSADLVSLVNDGDGHFADAGGSIRNALAATRLFSRGNGQSAFNAINGGVITTGPGAVASANAVSGAYARDGGTISAPSLTAQNNALNAITCVDAKINVPNLAGTGSQYGIYNDGGHVTADSGSSTSSA